MESPGHTAGSSSYLMTVEENGREYSVAIANMGTINPGKRLVVDPTYPGVADDFAETFRKQKALDVDVWVAAHGGQYGLHDKYERGQAYHPDTFVDPRRLPRRGRTAGEPLPGAARRGAPLILRGSRSDSLGVEMLNHARRRLSVAPVVLVGLAVVFAASPLEAQRPPVSGPSAGLLHRAPADHCRRLRDSPPGRQRVRRGG